MHGVNKIPVLILKAADVTSSNLMTCGLSDRQCGSMKVSSSSSCCQTKKSSEINL